MLCSTARIILWALRRLRNAGRVLHLHFELHRFSNTHTFAPKLIVTVFYFFEIEIVLHFFEIENKWRTREICVRHRRMQAFDTSVYGDGIPPVCGSFLRPRLETVEARRPKVEARAHVRPLQQPDGHVAMPDAQMRAG